MTIRAGGRVALIAATGLLVCVAGVSWTTTACDAASSNSESASTAKTVKHARYYKRYTHRKYLRAADKSSTDKKTGETEVAQAGVPAEIPAAVANANARMGAEVGNDTAGAMTARANALLAADQAAGTEGAPLTQVVEADQLNDVDRALQEPAQATTAATPPAKPVVTTAKAVSNDTSTWDQTSLIGKIFIAFGALLTVASAARMFMA